jgi:hypothetical protein
METKTIIYLVAAALILRVVIKVIVRFFREGQQGESVDAAASAEIITEENKKLEEKEEVGSDDQEINEESTVESPHENKESDN